MPTPSQISRWFCTDDFVYKTEKFSRQRNSQVRFWNHRFAVRRTIEAIIARIQQCDELSCHAAITFWFVFTPQVKNRIRFSRMMMLVMVAGIEQDRNPNANRRRIFETRMAVIWSLKIPAFAEFLTRSCEKTMWDQKKLEKYSTWAKDFWWIDEWKRVLGDCDTVCISSAYTPKPGTYE